MDEIEFYQDYMSEINARAGAEENYKTAVFTEEMCDFLVDQALIQSYDECFYSKTQLGIRIDAWNFNKENGELCLFISQFNPSTEVEKITQKQVETYFNRVERFFLYSIEGKYPKGIDESLPAYSVAHDLWESKGSISKIRFFLITNALVSERYKGIETNNFHGYQATYDVWDISRRARIAGSGKEKEDIIIDFTNFKDEGLEFLSAYDKTDKIESYLLVFPGDMLAQIYDKYGERLLEQNVRTFLQFRGGVNKSIRNTIKNEPEMFFAYNNGLSVTAEDVVIDDNYMTSVKNLQIVNGGQTTASIFMSKLQEKDKVDLSNIFVQAKMTVIDSDHVDEIVPRISKSANTQNKVSNSDFFSNHPFHKRIEDHSRRVLAPSKVGGLQETHWFYERARGQFANMQAKLTKSQKKKFLIQNPSDQKFTKTDLAKYENTFGKLPYFVSKGAQWNFGKFAEEISGKDEGEGLWEKNELQFNELYFKQLIAKAIIFKTLDKQIMKQSWYGGYKANIVTYTLAKFTHQVEKHGRFIDYLSIWQSQSIEDELLEQLLDIAEYVNQHITDTTENVTQYCKKKVCWDRLKEKKYPLKDSIIERLVDGEMHQSKKRRARNEQKLLSGIEAQIEVFNKGQEYWTKLYGWATKSNLFTETELSILNSTSRLNQAPPSEQQCVIILKIESDAIEEGFPG